MLSGLRAAFPQGRTAQIVAIGFISLAGGLVLSTVGWTYLNWKLTQRAPPISFGDRPNDNFMWPDKAEPGQMIKVCFTGIEHNRLCKSMLNEKTSCESTSRGRTSFDSAHPVKAPAQIGPLDPERKPKCREYKVPAECSSGPAEFTSVLKSECTLLDSTNPITVKGPTIKYTIVAPSSK